MKKITICLIAIVTWHGLAAQVDTAYVFNTSTPFGTLDIRLAKSATRYYYLQENETFSFRESVPGTRTRTYRDMTAWDSRPYAEGNLRERNGRYDYFIMNYRLLLPQGYDVSYEAGYPLIVLLHGAGERGNCWDIDCYWADRAYKPNTNYPAAPATADHPLLNNDHNLLHGGEAHLAARNLAGGLLPDDPRLHSRAYPGLVLVPQNLNGWDAATVQDMIRLVRLTIRKYNVDPDRVYIHGLSNGGMGTYEALKRAPWLFASAITMSAVSDAGIISRGLAQSVANIPLWTVQGGADTGPTPARTEGYVKAFREAGMDVRYTLYPNLGHGTWNTAYNEPDFFSWMLQKRKSDVRVFFGNAAVCATTGTGVRLGYPAGFHAYQWEKDGVVLADNRSNLLVATEPGVYRGRFSRVANPGDDDWNDWSQPVTVTVNSPQAARIELTGTHLMRGPDNKSSYNTVYLTSAAQDHKYTWYRNGAVINIPSTSLDDTTRVFKVTSSDTSKNGYYTLQTRGVDNCPAPLSEPVRLYFANSAPFLPDGDTPADFTAIALSNTEVRLNWTDRSAAESGYEIWRRKPGGSFVLAGRAARNSTSWTDKGLEPAVTYAYKIRAVAFSARSRYAPSDVVNTNLNVTTLPDNTPPAVPGNLRVVANTLSTITLEWDPANDDTGIRRYHLHYDDTVVSTSGAGTTFTLTALAADRAYSITVASEDLGGNRSAESAPVTGITYVSGLTYGHSTGAWTDLDQITVWNRPEFTGWVPNVTLAPRTQEEFFNFEFNGYLYLTRGGYYTFRTISDDGSRLSIDGTVVVDNDGLHGSTARTSTTTTMSPGRHAFNLKYFEYTSEQSLTVQYRGPDTDGNWRNIPDQAFRSAAAPPAAGNTFAAAATAPLDVRSFGATAPALEVSPNPGRPGDITLRSADLHPEEQAFVAITDLGGSVRFSAAVPGNELGTGIKPLANYRLPEGIYIVIVRQGAAVRTGKLIIRN